MEVQLGAGRGWQELGSALEGPPVLRPVHADVLETALHPEGMMAPQIVVGGAVALVGGDVDEIGALDEAEVGEEQADLSLAVDAFGLELFEVGIGPVHVHSVGSEQAEAEDEVFLGILGAEGNGYGQGFSRNVDVTLVTAVVEKADARDLHLTATPAALPVAVAHRFVARRRGGGPSRAGT